ncbi:hypothetical protein Tco_0217453 [Tanacetum coccineum]
MKENWRKKKKKSLARKEQETLSEESAKKQKLENDAEIEELQVYLNIVPEEESLDVESLATKYPIVDWETRILANDQYYYQIKRADGSVKHYKIFSAMLYDFDEAKKDVLEFTHVSDSNGGTRHRQVTATWEERGGHGDVVGGAMSNFKMSWDRYGELSYFEFIWLLIVELQVDREHGYITHAHQTGFGEQYEELFRGSEGNLCGTWVGYDVLNDVITRVMLHWDDPSAWAWSCGVFAFMFYEPYSIAQEVERDFHLYSKEKNGP